MILVFLGFCERVKRVRSVPHDPCDRDHDCDDSADHEPDEPEQHHVTRSQKQRSVRSSLTGRAMNRRSAGVRCYHDMGEIPNGSRRVSPTRATRRFRCATNRDQGSLEPRAVRHPRRRPDAAQRLCSLILGARQRVTARMVGTGVASATTTTPGVLRLTGRVGLACICTTSAAQRRAISIARACRRVSL